MKQLAILVMLLIPSIADAKVVKRTMNSVLYTWVEINGQKVSGTYSGKNALWDALDFEHEFLEQHPELKNGESKKPSGR
jgi:hypothetical protein